MMIELAFKRLPHGTGIEPPRYESKGAAGADIRAAIDEELVLQPGERALVPSGFSFAVPQDYEMQIRPRSGLAALHGVTVLNTPGTVDSDYRGEVKIILINLGAEAFRLQRGDRIAQAVVAPVTRASYVEVADLEATVRGEGGFGSTGV
ncbi:deoxyuridine 5'-triphosphate nucleotidohydrolase (dut) [Fulvimarina pelagi HTCC2506]|uniref:Deoxyuridine 5'-triphosphate nucleotidohydrolase n=1 Tax=Fulvimarina pelagi HTCC2506 TaxID=314231 RepID=Q0G5Y8_9HYPH|nr:dUTP diphosphatase [Fulvimarina pelagi]EAU42926.1 deoxyuridine 5'-triphosphate nucleotidohydrolase (dut) [Fulvimarina pelagi HTCC2506]